MYSYFNDIMYTNFVEIPSYIMLNEEHQSIQGLIRHTYERITRHYKDLGYLRDRAILSPCYKEVEAINYMIMEEIPGDFVEIEAVNQLKIDGSMAYTIDDEDMRAVEENNFPKQL